MRFLHPLSKYPGPLLASPSNTYKAYYVYNLTLHEKLLELHKTYGPIVRAIALIYKGGRAMGKTEFYNAFTAFNPNLFGGRDEDAYPRTPSRQLSHRFAQVSVQKLEPLIEAQMKVLVDKLHGFAETGKVFDFKHMLSLYVLDILGEVAFARPFGVQLKGEAEELHAVNDHLLLAGVIGELPFQDLTKMLSRLSPVPWMRKLMKSRNKLKDICAQCVRFKINNTSNRPDLLKSLVEAVDPETGSHSTAGTLTLLFWHLIQNSEMLATARREITTTLGIPPLHNGLCAKENFRANPVFTMPLWRRVGYPGGFDIGGHHIPQGTSICISNYVLHYNPSIWGPDHPTFNPIRWLDDEYAKEKARFLIPFSIGNRMCIGRSLAMTNILKSVTMLLSRFDFEAVERRKSVAVRSPEIGEMEGEFLVRVSVGEGSSC
ncbi:cytochrome P450 [Aspergillus aurantiobrunneus]